MKRILSIALVLAMTVTMCFGTVGLLGAEHVHAADSDIALSVWDDDTIVKQYTLDDLKAIAAAEGDIEYKFSGYNRNPSFYVYGDPDNKNTKPASKEAMKCIGPTVAGILADAGVTYTDEQLIRFAAADGLTESFTAGDLFQERYYFPKGKTSTSECAKPSAEAYADAEPVVPIIDLNARIDDPETEENEDQQESVFRFGQVHPNEQNVAVFVKYVADGGSIIVDDAPTEAWPDITGANYNSGDILPGTVIELDVPQGIKGKKVAMYYTLDGSEPGPGCDIYNFDKYGGIRLITVPKDQETFTIKVKAVGYGKLDSNTTTFTYNVVNDYTEAPMEFTAAVTDDYKVNLIWSAVADADGYELSKYNHATETQEVIADTADAEFCDENTEIDNEYSYTIRSYKILSSGQKAYSTTNNVVSVTVEDKTPPAKPVLNSVAKTGYAGIQVKWTAVDGADGYEILRTDAKGNKFTKTFASGTTTSWKNTGLKTGTKYTYKVRAYKELKDGTKIYGAYSGVKSATPALNKPVISKLTAGSKSITVKWNKVQGANGYKIYRSATKNGTYTCVKTITKGGTLSWKNTGLKKGKTYYYKVKAYRIVDKKNVYSNMSLSKYTKSK